MTSGLTNRYEQKIAKGAKNFLAVLRALGGLLFQSGE
jgi:hypothetical protein